MLKLILVILLLINFSQSFIFALATCCTAACIGEFPPIDGGMVSGAIIASCTSGCIGSGGVVTGYLGPICVAASFLPW